jgi:hypothetical protein
MIKRVLKRCHCCQGPFGLVRHYYNRHQFCRPKCVADYQQKLRRLVAEKKPRVSVIREWYAV